MGLHLGAFVVVMAMGGVLAILLGLLTTPLLPVHLLVAHHL
jgi:hypothetical protein